MELKIYSAVFDVRNSDAGTIAIGATSLEEAKKTLNDEIEDGTTLPKEITHIGKLRESAPPYLIDEDDMPVYKLGVIDGLYAKDMRPKMPEHQPKQEEMLLDAKGKFNIAIHGNEIQKMLFLYHDKIKSIEAKVSYKGIKDENGIRRESLKIHVWNLNFFDHKGEQYDGLPYSWMQDIQGQIKDIVWGEIDYFAEQKSLRVELKAVDLAIPQVSSDTYLVGQTIPLVKKEEKTLFSKIISAFIRDNASKNKTLGV